MGEFKMVALDFVEEDIKITTLNLVTCPLPQH